MIHACDFSKKAVAVVRDSEHYDPKHIQANVWDVTGDELPPGLAEGSVDVAIMIFIFSALSPRQWAQAVDNVYRLLKPGGALLFRDYGRGDLAQVRFKKGRYLEENFYIRGDGTRVYFFDKDELAQIWMGRLPPNAMEEGKQSANSAASATALDSQDKRWHNPRFSILNLGVDRRLLVNRAKKIKMHRCWLQGRFVKLPQGVPTEVAEHSWLSRLKQQRCELSIIAHWLHGTKWATNIKHC